MTNSVDLATKLLANENINIVKQNVMTAAFDIKSRTLILPQWKEMTPAIDGMLRVHEIGHALYTDPSYMALRAERLPFQGAQDFLNILEDVRVEKLTKRKYPGTRRVLADGYRELNDLDFFGVQTRDLKDLHLMDRINLYFKCGISCGVQFSAKEKKFLTRAEQTESVDDVVQLCLDIYRFLKEDKEIREEDDQEELQSANGKGDDGEDEFDDFEDFDGEGEEGDEDWDGEGEGDEFDEDNQSSFKDFRSGPQPKPNDNDDVGTPITNRVFQSKLQELADPHATYEYVAIGKSYINPIISYKTIIKKSRDTGSDEYKASYRPYITTFKSQTKNNIDYLIKEFEMKKAATAYKRATVSKTGSLDTRKLYAYKINDDLFRRVTSVPQGKNHGMLFLLDWSSSMRAFMKNTIEQMINLVMFCHRAQIPFQVLAFTDDINAMMDREYPDTNTKSEIYTSTGKLNLTMVDQQYALLELFSSEMSLAEMNEMINHLLSNIVTRVYNLSSTPLNASLCYMYNHVGEFKKRYNVEKVSFITLTDGESSWISIPFLPSAKIILVDEVTKQERTINSYYSPDQTNKLLSAIKARWNCTVLGFFVTNDATYSLASAVNAHSPLELARNHTYVSEVVTRLKKEIKQNGYASLKGTGRDDLFIMKSSKINTTDLAVTSDQNVRSLAKQLGKFLTSRKTSRVLLSKFVDYIA